MASELYTMNPVRQRKSKASKSKAKRKVPRRKTASVAAPKPRRARRAKAKTRTVVKFRTIPRKTKGRRRRAGKRGFGGMNLNTFIKAAQGGLINGAGAFANDLALGFVRPMLPTVLSYGQGRHFTRIALGLVLGNLVKRFGGRMGSKFGDAISTGAATVAGYDFMKEFVQPMLPAGVVLGEYTDMNSMGEYVSGPGANYSLGYASSAQTAPPSEMGNVESGYYYS